MYPRLISFKTPEFLQGFLPDTLSLYSYGFFIALGIFICFLILQRRTKKFGVDSDQLSSIFFWVIVASFVGGRLFFFLEDFQKYASDPSLILRIKGGGFVFYGSLLFAIPTIVIWLRRKKIPVRPFLDEIAIIGPVIHSFGRIGCFLSGCCHGKVCNSAIGVIYNHPETMAEPTGVPLYPTQFFDIGVNLFALAVVFYFLNRKKFDGQLFLLYISIYAVGRSIVEIFRGDEARGFLFDGLLSHSQFLAILILIGAVLLWRSWSKKGLTTY